MVFDAQGASSRTTARQVAEAGCEREIAMGNGKEPADFAIELAKELARQVPVKDVYQDGLSGGTKEAGQLLTDLVKTVRLALAPIQLMGALQDRLRHFIDRSIARVPEAKRIPPAPQILGPVIEAIRYEPE